MKQILQSFETGAPAIPVESLKRIEDRPEYLRIIWPKYVVGRLYQSLVNSTGLLELFRRLLVGTLRKSISEFDWCRKIIEVTEGLRWRL